MSKLRTYFVQAEARAHQCWLVHNCRSAAEAIRKARGGDSRPGGTEEGGEVEALHGEIDKINWSTATADADGKDGE